MRTPSQFASTWLSHTTRTLTRRQSDESEPKKSNSSSVVLPAVLIPIVVLVVAVGGFFLYRRRKTARRRREVAELTGRGTARPFSPLVSFGTSIPPGQTQPGNPRAFTSPHVPQPLPVMTMEIRRPVSYATTIGESGLPLGLESMAPSSPTQTFTEPETPHRHSMAVSTIAPTIASSRPVSADFRIFRAPSSVSDVPPVPALPRSHTQQFSVTAEGYCEDGYEYEYDSNGERVPQLRALSPISTFGGTTLHGHTRHSTDSSYAVRWTPAIGPEDVPPVPPLPSAVPHSPDTVMSPVGTFGMRESSAQPISRSVSLSAPESISRASEASRHWSLLPKTTSSGGGRARPPLPTIPSATVSPLDLSSDQSAFTEPPSTYRLSLDQQVGLQRPAPAQRPTRSSPPQLLRRLTVDTVSAAASGSVTVVATAGPSSAPANQRYGASGTPCLPALVSRPEDEDNEYMVSGELHDDSVPMTALSPSPFPHDAPPKPKKRRTLLLERRERRLRLALADKAVASAVAASASAPLKVRSRHRETDPHLLRARALLTLQGEDHPLYSDEAGNHRRPPTLFRGTAR